METLMARKEKGGKRKEERERRKEERGKIFEKIRPIGLSLVIFPEVGFPINCEFDSKNANSILKA